MSVQSELFLELNALKSHFQLPVVSSGSEWFMKKVSVWFFVRAVPHRLEVEKDESCVGLALKSVRI